MACDTLAYARRLKQAGMPEAQAEAVAEATRDAIAADAATKADITDLKHDIENVRHEIAAIRTDLAHEIAAVRREIAETGLRVTVRLGTLMAVGVGILAALIKL
jgi:hypothetical protein